MTGRFMSGWADSAVTGYAARAIIHPYLVTGYEGLSGRAFRGMNCMLEEEMPVTAGCSGIPAGIDRIAEKILAGGIPEEFIPDFRKEVQEFYKGHSRKMPWRSDPSPYNVFISEVMLQQTQVPRVLKMYPGFISRFPDFETLAAAAFSDVLAAWKGLGYNRRARALLQTAKIITREMDGVLPSDPGLLESFPQIGHATACSIAAFAYEVPVVFVETNIRRVFLYTFFPGAQDVADSDILPWVRDALDTTNPRHWYYALMDLGTVIGSSVRNPNQRSAHYSRQKPFSGSDRKIRGMVLSHLLAAGETGEFDLAGIAGVPVDRMNHIVASLVQDNLVKVENGRVCLGD
jgi:A/G-specific adenine glycosylase